MYVSYARGDKAWAEGVRRAEAFVDGALHRHLTTCTRHGRLGVPAGLDARALCELLPRALQDHGELGLFMQGGAAQLLVLPTFCPPEPLAWCYAAWPGIEAWDGLIEPHLPRGVTLLHTRWNQVPHLHRAPARMPLTALGTLTATA